MHPRHPLQELIVPSYVPNDAYLVGGQADSAETQRPSSEYSSLTASVTAAGPTPAGPTMLMMTGPNYSGKSVYLKQIALIVYLAHIGSFVPAKQAEIGITDKILTRIATRETVSSTQSAFMIDLQQICMALTLATNRSLLIIDEFGKGTNSFDGAGLACGVFEHLLNLHDRAPRVIAATHFHEIFENGFLPVRPSLSYQYMEVRLDTNAAHFEDQITHLYRVRNGRSIASYGTSCAAMSGISTEIVSRAHDLIELALKGEDLTAACATLSRDEASDLEQTVRLQMMSSLPRIADAAAGTCCQTLPRIRPGRSIKEHLDRHTDWFGIRLTSGDIHVGAVYMTFVARMFFRRWLNYCFKVILYEFACVSQAHSHFLCRTNREHGG